MEKTKGRKTDGPEDENWLGPQGAPWKDTWKHFGPNNGEGEFKGLGESLRLKGAWSIPGSWTLKPVVKLSEVKIK